MQKLQIKYLLTIILFLFNSLLFAQFNNSIVNSDVILVPYLQTPTPNSIYVCWHDSTSTPTTVEFGETTDLGKSATGTSTMYNLVNPFRWHSVKLTGLYPNIKYFYRVKSGSGISKIYSFKTLPEKNFNGKLRFLLLADTHEENTAMPIKVIQEAKKKIQQLYNDSLQNTINMVLHSGDLVMEGNIINQWIPQFFKPIAPISATVPFMTVAGNHEGESWNYYNYMMYDEISALPDHYNEKFWSLTVCNTAIIGLNSNVINSSRIKQPEWLNQKLKEIESDPSIDFVIVLVHHMPFSELWGEGMLDAGSLYVRDIIMPILKKYSKVVHLAYGHTHGYERGTIESEAPNAKGDFNIVCGGGGGGKIDRWNLYRNTDYPEIYFTLDHYSYQIVEIDINKKTYECSLYSLGNLSKERNSELMDRWNRKLEQASPEKPVAESPYFIGSNIIFKTSKMIGSDSLMSVKIQVAEDSEFNNLVLSKTINKKNVYGADANFNPIDLNFDIDLTRLAFPRMLFMNDRSYFYRVRYRDHNNRWSGWSNTSTFTVPYDEFITPRISDFDLKQNTPNPFNSETKIIYRLRQPGHVTLRVFDVLGNEIQTLVNEEKPAGQYQIIFDGINLNSGVYFYQFQTNGVTQTKKLVLLK